MFINDLLTNQNKSFKDEFEKVLFCDCKLYKFYQLFCQYIWQFNIMHNVIIFKNWKWWTFMFENDEFEIYESIIKTYVINETAG